MHDQPGATEEEQELVPERLQEEEAMRAPAFDEDKTAPAEESDAE